MPIQSLADDAVAAELESLLRCPIHDLRARWRALFRGEPPPAFGPDLLRRSIAQKLQEELYGKVSATVQRELNRIVAELEKSPTNRIQLPRRIKAGAVLVRDWKGATHRVTVTENGFSYQERNYASLSEIAREITGTRWNGPRFFGLRSSDKSAESIPDSGTTNRKRGRPSKQPVKFEPTRMPEAGHGP
jgi:hypothetical protein